jgi:Zn finger protein HypA/HybF involved in hydrogenase expression
MKTMEAVSDIYPDHYVRECWLCGHALTHEDNHLTICPVCGDERLVPFGTRFVMSDL